MIEELKKNIDTEISILREISNYESKIEFSNQSDKKLLEDTIFSLIGNLKTINEATPAILNNISMVKKLPVKSEFTNLEKVKFVGESKGIEVVISKKDRNNFLKELSLNESLIKRLKKKSFIQEEKFTEYKSPRGYIKFSNRLFLKNSMDMLKKGYFKSFSIELKKANIDILSEAFISMMFLSTIISFVISIFLAAFFLIFNINLVSPFIEINHNFSPLRILEVILIPLIIPLITFVFLYFYPSTEKGSIAKRIDQELPFAVIHMSAISGSGIPPTEIFRIIGLGREYPFLKKEVRKILNQINLYGYDLVTALTNVSKTTPSTNFSELLSGLATTINSGGSLQEFFEKRAETLLLDYRLEREKYTKTAETFMDIYISIVIAAPMILMVLLIVMAAAHLGSFTPLQITVLIISVISLINIIFLFLLHNKQPVY